MVEGLRLGPGDLKLLLSSLNSEDHLTFMGFGFSSLQIYCTCQEIDVNIHIETSKFFGFPRLKFITCVMGTRI